MFDILAVTGPVYLAIALGYGATRWGLFDRAELRVLGKFVIHLALPALLFNAMATRRFGDIFNVAYALTYLSATYALLGIGWLWCRHLARLDTATSAVYLMGMSCPNSSFVGYPILLLTVAPVAGVTLAQNTLMENLLVTPLLLALAESGRTGGGHGLQVLARTLGRLARSPMILAMAAGLLVSLSGLSLPAPVARTVNLFALTSGALALFVIGGSLVGLPMRRMGGQVAPIVLGKLVLHPLAVFAASLLVPALGGPLLDAELRMALLVLSAVPMMSIYPILAQAYGHEGLSAAAMLATTLTSFFTLSGLLWIVR